MRPEFITDPKFQQRFFKHLKPAASGCLEWQGAMSRGYGQIKVANQMWYVHRIAWMLANGPIPDGLLVCHSCDNPICCEPAHLWLGTIADNVHDRDAKNRQVHGKGELHANHSLTDEQVREIRATYRRGSHEQGIVGLAVRFGVGTSTIHSILHRKTWTHI